MYVNLKKKTENNLISISKFASFYNTANFVDYRNIYIYYIRYFARIGPFRMDKWC